VCPVPGPVCYIAEEGKASDLIKRLKLMVDGYGLKPEQLTDFKISVQNRVQIDNVEWQRKIDSLCDLYKFRALFLDTLTSSHMRDENNAQSMRPVLDFLSGLQINHGCSVIVVHHQRKATKDDTAVAGQKIRGTSAFHGWLDSSISLTKNKDESLIGVEIEHRNAESPDPFSFAIRKDAQSIKLVYGADNITDKTLREMIEFIKLKRSCTNKELRDEFSSVNGLIYRDLTIELRKRVGYEKKEMPDSLGHLRKQGVWTIEEQEKWEDHY